MDNWKYIKVFVSSTFLDMDIERDALKNIVEPRLNETLKDYSCSLEFVDLRHSVKTNTTMSILEREKQIFNVCLEEIDNCKPYFMGVIGHRYGWIPAEDGVPCPRISLPDDFPIKEDNLSVTMYEFLHGFLSSKVPRERTIVFMRSSKSYLGLDEREREKYIESSDKKLNYVNLVREFIKSKDSDYQVVDYSLPISSYSDSDMLSWADLVYKNIIDVIKDEFNDVDEYDKFANAQEYYVQKHIENFRGRLKEQKECLKKINSRGSCIIASKEMGLGLTSFFCKMYDNLRQDKNHICLIYCDDANYSFSREDVLTSWLLLLDNADGGGRREQILSSKDNKERVLEIWGKITSSLSDKGYDIYVFCESYSSCTFFMSYGLSCYISVTTIYYADYMFHMRPLMYMIEPYDKETIKIITKDLRPQLVDALLSRGCSSHANWLQLSMTIIGKMNKQDYVAIRSREEKDNEERIIQHQIKLIKELPDGADDAILFWVDRLKHIFGQDLMDKYLFLMSLNTLGWKESILSDILGIAPTLLVTLRQMIGITIIAQTSEGLWAFKDPGIEDILTQNYKLKDYKKLIDDAYNNLKSIPVDQPAYEQLIFKLAMMNGDVDFCSEFIKCHVKGNSSISLCARDAYVWYATQHKYDFLSFISTITSRSNNASYQFFYNLLQWSKMLFYNDDTLDEHLAAVERIISNLRMLWQKHEIDLKTYSVTCDALACRGDYYRKKRDYKNLFDTIDYGLLFCKDYYQREPLFLTGYLYWVMVKKDFIQNKGDQYLWLEKMFLIPERKNQFNYSSNSDISIYALLMRDTVESMLETDHATGAQQLCLKSLELLVDFLNKQEIKLVDTMLVPADTKRNLVATILTYIKLYFHYDFMSGDAFYPRCEEILKICKDCCLLKDKDLAYEFYHKAMAAFIFIQEDDEESKFKKLMMFANDILRNYDDANNSWKFVFMVTERNKKEVEPMFEVWLYTNSLALYLISDIPDGEIDFIDNEGLGIMTSIIKSDGDFLFENRLKLLLPFIGAKSFEENGLPPRKIWDSMLILYVSMLYNEATKDTIDLQYMIELYNSSIDLANAIIEHDVTIPMIVFMSDLENIKDFINDNITDDIRDNIDFQARYNNFRDCFGIEGDVYTSEDGLWANGDPELNDIDNDL